MGDYKYLFGPVPSRRFGRSLGVDLNPYKTCSLDCVFCQLGRTSEKRVMRVLLIYTDIGTGQLFHYQHGLGWLSAVLKRAGHQVGLIYLEKEIPEPEFIQQVKEFSPQLLGFSCSTLQYQFVKKYARAVKEELGLPLVIGGIHPTVEPEPVLKEAIFDFLIRGEGEEPLLELVEALEQGRDFSQIKNLGFLKQGEVKLNSLREPVALD